MKNILCFGDSNTYGYNPVTKGRFPDNIRWTGRLKCKVEKYNYSVIEEGLVGRTTVFEDSVRTGRKGSDFLIPLLESHFPVDTVILMLVPMIVRVFIIQRHILLVRALNYL